MKKTFSTIGISLLVAVSSAFATSVTVTSGGSSVTPGTNTTSSGSVAAGPFTASASSGSVSASVTEYVIKDSTTGDYDFLYEVKNTSSINDAFSTVGVGTYTTVCSTCASVADNGTTTYGTTAPGTIAANSATRTGSGDTIDFGFAANTLSPGTTTQWLEVDTNATAYTSVNAFTETIDGGVIMISGGYAPTIPEPATLGLLGGSLALLGVVRWRKSKKA